MEFVFLSMYLIWLQQIDGKEFCNKKGDVTVSRAILVFTSRVISMSLLLFVAIESFVLYTVGVTQIFLGILTLVVLVLGGSSILLWFGENDSE